MDRLSRIALVLALTFIGSCAEIEVGEGSSQFWAFLGLVGSGFVLLLLSVGRTFELLGDWLGYSAYPLIITVAAGVIAFVAPFQQIAEAFKSPRVLAGSCEHTVCYTHLVLRQDGTAEDMSICFGRTVNRGRYFLCGDTVVLKFAGQSPPSIRNKLLLSKTELRELPTADTTRSLLVFRLYINELSDK